MTDIKIDVVRLQPLEAGFACLDQIFARETRVMRSGRAKAHERLRDEDPVFALTLQRFTQDLFRRAKRIHIGRIDRRDAGFAAHVEHALRLGDAQSAHLGEPVLPSYRHRAETEDRHAQPGIPKPPLLHTCSYLLRSASPLGLPAPSLAGTPSPRSAPVARFARSPDRNMSHYCKINCVVK